MSALAAPVFAAEYNPGVKVGDWVKYGNYIGIGENMDYLNDFAWAKSEVIAVDGSAVTLRHYGEFVNGTAVTETSLTADLEVGIESGFQRYIVASNLTAGDPVIMRVGADVINRTETRTYLGVSRGVNILEFVSDMGNSTMSVVYVYDQLSGMHLEHEVVVTEVGDPGSVLSKIAYSVVETNLFGQVPIETETPEPTVQPTEEPTAQPTQEPTLTPSAEPTDTTTEGNLSSEYIYGALIAVVAIVAVLAYVLLRKKR